MKVLRLAAALAVAMGVGSASGGMGRAATITVLSAGAVEPGLRAAAEAFRRETGHEATVRFATAPVLRQRLGSTGGEAVDVAIAPPAALDECVKAGCVDGALRVVVGRVGVGVAVRAGAPKPDISTAAAFITTLRAAREIACARPATGSPS